LRLKNLAEYWLNGFPIGNGEQAAMVWGDARDCISLNHEWLWRGETRHRENLVVPEGALSQVREFLDKEDYFRATMLANTWFGGKGGESGTKNRIDNFQPAGDICFSLSEENTSGGRTLFLETGIAESVRSRNGKKAVILESFVDVCRNVIVCRWSSEELFSGVLTYERPEDSNAEETCRYSENGFQYACAFHGGISFKTTGRMQCDGVVQAEEKGIRIKNATELLLTAKICVCTEGDKPYPVMPDYDFESGKREHASLFSEKMQAFELAISCEETDGFLEDRMENIKSGNEDDSLIFLFYNYGKYLYISANLLGELPANLQGKWNWDILPPWWSDYHFNINLQMNYWMAEPMGLSYGTEKLVNLFDRFVPHGKQSAKELYGCRGIWIPHASDVWGRATPEAFGYGVWLGAAPWLARHYWERYLYGGDKEFLEKRCYPFLKEVAQFFEDYVVPQNGTYEIYPSQSPENRFEGAGNLPVATCKSSAMDVQLVYDALGYAISAAEILGVDKEEVSKWKEIREHLPEFKIGADGRLLEWDRELPEVEPGHRHVSHLYGIYPSDLFTEEKRPEQFAAAKKTMDFRVSHGGGHTGWSRAWTACFYARFGDGNMVREHMSELVRGYTTESLLDTHPYYLKTPPIAFQIDGNFGAVAAINETVAQFKNGKLYLLPALPDKWQKGSVRGYCTPGGHKVDFSWDNGKLAEIKVALGFSESLILVANGETKTVSGKAGETVKLI